MPEIPRPMIIVTGNRLIHVYHDVNRDIIWSTVQNDLPSLIASLETFLAGEPESDTA